MPDACCSAARTWPTIPENRPAKRSWTDRLVCRSLIAGEKLKNIGIRGQGTIDGQGAGFGVKYLVRPYLIRFVECEDVLVEGVHLRNSAMWLQHYLACERVTVRGVTVFNFATRNNDGGGYRRLPGCLHLGLHIPLRR